MMFAANLVISAGNISASHVRDLQYPFAGKSTG